MKVALLFSSGKRDSDPRPRPWQGRALPTELFPRGEPIIVLFFRLVKGNVGELIKNILFFARKEKYGLCSVFIFTSRFVRKFAIIAIFV